MATPRRKKTKPQPKTLAHHLRHAHQRVVHHLKHTFIPHAGNDYQPHALRPKALAWYATIVIVAKLVVTGLLFLVYPTPGFFSTATSSRFFELTNTSRESAKIPDLKINPKLERAAGKKADAILASNTFAHSLNGKPFWWWIQQQKYKFSTAGENLALDFADADIAHQALMDSPGHRANILNKKYTEVGIAVRTGTFQGRTTTVVVELFAKPLPVVTRPTVAKASQPSTSTPTPAQLNTPPPAPTYAATLASAAVQELTLKPGQAQVVTLDYTNAGTVSWEREKTTVALQATDPVGRLSVLATPSWVSASQPVAVAPALVKNGQTGHWVFSVVAPQQIGVYAERFALTAPDGTQLPNTQVTLNVAVEPTNDPQPLATVSPTQPSVQPPATGPRPEPGLTSESLTTTGELKTAATAQPAPPTLLPSPKLTTVARNAVTASNNLFLFFVMFLTAALLVNTTVRWEVQHRHVVIGGLLLLALTGAMIAFGFHFLQIIPAQALRII